jgi:hypothetical protein
MHAGKTLERAGATPLLAAFSRPKLRGIAPARIEPLNAVFCPRAYRETIEPACEVHKILNTKGENLDGSSESTHQTTEDDTSPTSARR